MTEMQTNPISDAPACFSSPDFQRLAQIALSDSLKIDRNAWPVLAQHSLFEPEFFSASKAKLSREVAGDDELAALLTRAGLHLLREEVAAGSSHNPFNAAAMLLSFPEISTLPNGFPDNPADWICHDASQDLHPYWTESFPWLEAAAIEHMATVRLLQRKAGAPKLYATLVSCHHQAQFRRMAAWLLLDPGKTSDCHAVTPDYNVQWGEALRCTTEKPLFISLIASLYEAIYSAL